MKELLILRHAKSSWKYQELSDHDRPLNKRGRRDAPRMGRLIRVRGLLPDLVVSSTAVRAMTTAHLASSAAGYTGSVELEPSLYLGGVHPYLEALARLGGKHRRAQTTNGMLVARKQLRPDGFVVVDRPDASQLATSDVFLPLK